jgi:hypothetical protein
VDPATAREILVDNLVQKMNVKLVKKKDTNVVTLNVKTMKLLVLIAKMEKLAIIINVLIIYLSLLLNLQLLVNAQTKILYVKDYVREKDHVPKVMEQCIIWILKLKDVTKALLRQNIAIGMLVNYSS